MKVEIDVPIEEIISKTEEKIIRFIELRLKENIKSRVKRLIEEVDIGKELKRMRQEDYDKGYKDGVDKSYDIETNKNKKIVE